VAHGQGFQPPSAGHTRTWIGPKLADSGFENSDPIWPIRLPNRARSAQVRGSGEANTSLLDTPGQSRPTRSARSPAEHAKVPQYHQEGSNLKQVPPIRRACSCCDPALCPRGTDPDRQRRNYLTHAKPHTTTAACPAYPRGLAVTSGSHSPHIHNTRITLMVRAGRLPPSTQTPQGPARRGWSGPPLPCAAAFNILGRSESRGSACILATPYPAGVISTNTHMQPPHRSNHRLGFPNVCKEDSEHGQILKQCGASQPASLMASWPECEQCGLERLIGSIGAARQSSADVTLARIHHNFDCAHIRPHLCLRN
jgi:hypothetical protein